MPKINNLYNDTIQKHLADLIAKGSLKPGDRLPSERDLARQFNTSNTPVRQATDALVARGLLVRMPGKGTFVREPDTNKKTTGRLAVLYLPDRESFFASSFYGRIFEGVDTEANARNKDLILRPLQRKPDEDPCEAVRGLLPEADGFIIIDAKPALFRRIGPMLRHLEKPVVMVNYEDIDGTVPSVTAANVAIGRMMTSFLINQGHTRISFCAVAPDSSGSLHPNAVRRLEGYRLALLDHGLKPDDRFVIGPGGTYDDLISITRKPDSITAAYFPYDTAAHRFLRAAPELGISVPDDLSVVASLNMRESAECTPPLTTASVPLPQLGIQAVKAVTEGTAPGMNISIPGEIIERATHKKNLIM